MFKSKIKFLHPASFSETLEQLFNKQDEASTKVSELIEEFHENGLLCAMIIFSLPIAVPLPYPPGFTTIASIPLLLLSVQILRGKNNVLLPRKVSSYEISNKKLKLMAKKIIPVIKFIERYSKPRITVARSVYCEQFIGFVSLLGSISICVPLPLTNAVPALGITIMSVGLLNRDGIVIIAGIVVTVIGLIIALGAIMATWIGIKYILFS